MKNKKRSSKPYYNLFGIKQRFISREYSEGVKRVKTDLVDNRDFSMLASIMALS